MRAPGLWLRTLQQWARLTYLLSAWETRKALPLEKKFGTTTSAQTLNTWLLSDTCSQAGAPWDGSLMWQKRFQSPATFPVQSSPAGCLEMQRQQMRLSEKWYSGCRQLQTTWLLPHKTNPLNYYLTWDKAQRAGFYSRQHEAKTRKLQNWKEKEK